MAGKIMEPFQLDAKTVPLAAGQVEIAVQAPDLYSHPASSLQGQLQYLNSRPVLELQGQFQSAGEVASARQFFTPKVEIQALTPHAAMPGLEHSTAAAVKAASQAISPLLQLIMRLPTHLSIFSSFFEVMKGFLLPHIDLLGQFSQLTHIDLSGLGHLSTLGSHSTIDLSMLSAHANIFQNTAFDAGNITSVAKLHLSPADSIQHSLNVSAGVDLQHPQFEKLSSLTATSDVAGSSVNHMAVSGDVLAGPGISAQAITPQLASAQRIFTTRFFDSPTGSPMNSGTNMLASSQTLASNNVGGNSTALSPSYNQAYNQVPTTSTTTSNISHAHTDHAASASTLQGLRAKAFTFANFSHHHLHSIAEHGHSAVGQSVANHSVASHSVDHSPAEQPAAHVKTHIAQSPNDLTKHSHSGAKMIADNVSSTPEPAAVSQTASANTVYTIKPGDTLWRIAQDLLGDGKRWQEIFNLNIDKLGGNPNLIHSGFSINVPQPDQNAMPDTSSDATMVASQAAPHSYTVKGGDDLWRISEHLLGGGQHWPELFKINGETIGSNPGMIFPGQKFALPGHFSNSVMAHRGPTATTQLAHAAPAHVNQSAHAADANVSHQLAQAPAHAADSNVSHQLAHAPAHAADTNVSHQFAHAAPTHATDTNVSHQLASAASPHATGNSVSHQLAHSAPAHATDTNVSHQLADVAPSQAVNANVNNQLAHAAPHNAAVSNINNQQLAHAASIHPSISSVNHQLTHAAPTRIADARVNNLHNQMLPKVDHHAASAHAVVASNFKLMPENAMVHNVHPQTQISMRPHINSNNGLTIEANHDHLLSGMGAAQASGAGHSAAISKAASNLVAGKAKSVVTFSLVPDLSSLPAAK